MGPKHRNHQKPELELPLNSSPLGLALSSIAMSSPMYFFSKDAQATSRVTLDETVHPRATGSCSPWRHGASMMRALPVLNIGLPVSLTAIPITIMLAFARALDLTIHASPGCHHKRQLLASYSAVSTVHQCVEDVCILAGQSRWKSVKSPWCRLIASLRGTPPAWFKRLHEKIDVMQYVHQSHATHN